jgi:hypothetical protein
MVQDRLFGYRQEGLVGALATFHTGFLAYPANPFVGAGGRVAFLAGIVVPPQLGIHIVPTPEEMEKKGDLVLRRQRCWCGYGRGGSRCCAIRILIVAYKEAFP